MSQLLLFLVQQSLPPVRNQRKKKRKKNKDLLADPDKGDKLKDGSRISSYDYRSWDKFDVVSLLELHN